MVRRGSPRTVIISTGPEVSHLDSVFIDCRWLQGFYPSRFLSANGRILALPFHGYPETTLFEHGKTETVPRVMNYLFSIIVAGNVRELLCGL